MGQPDLDELGSDGEALETDGPFDLEGADEGDRTVSEGGVVQVGSVAE